MNLRFLVGVGTFLFISFSAAAGNFWDSWPVCADYSSSVMQPTSPTPSNPGFSTILSSRVSASPGDPRCPLIQSNQPKDCVSDMTSCSATIASSYCDATGQLRTGSDRTVSCKSTTGPSCGTTSEYHVVGCERCKIPTANMGSMPRVTPISEKVELECLSQAGVPGQDGVKVTNCEKAPDCPVAGVPCCRVIAINRDNSGICGAGQEVNITSCYMGAATGSNPGSTMPSTNPGTLPTKAPPLF